MPNHIATSIVITGKVANVEKVFETMFSKNVWGDEKAFSFHQTIPVPDEVFNAPRDYLGEPLAGWMKDNWGTSQDCYELSQVTGGNGEPIVVECYTAWSECRKWARAVAIKYDVVVKVEWENLDDVGSGKFMYTKESAETEKNREYVEELRCGECEGTGRSSYKLGGIVRGGREMIRVIGEEADKKCDHCKGIGKVSVVRISKTPLAKC